MTPLKVDAGFRTSRQNNLTSLGPEKREAVFRGAPDKEHSFDFCSALIAGRESGPRRLRLRFACGGLPSARRISLSFLGGARRCSRA